jgi:hypothetical protein
VGSRILPGEEGKVGRIPYAGVSKPSPIVLVLDFIGSDVTAVYSFRSSVSFHLDSLVTSHDQKTRTRTRTIGDSGRPEGYCTNTACLPGERFLPWSPATQLMPWRAERRPKRRSPGSVPGPGPDLFPLRKRSAANLAWLVHRSLCRSYLNLHAECQPAVQCFCIGADVLFFGRPKTISERLARKKSPEFRGDELIAG